MKDEITPQRLEGSLPLAANNNARWIYLEECIPVRSVQHAVAWQKTQIGALRGRKVALCPSSNFNVAWQLCCLDGQVEAILILPFEQSASVHLELCQKAECDFVLGSLEGSEIPEVEFPTYGNVMGRHAESDTPPVVSSACDTHWIIPTSGTSGTPKLVAHTLDGLVGSTKRDIEKGREFVWGLLYDIGRFAGLQVFLQALLGGSSLVFTEREDPIAERIDALINGGCNALSATPSLWRKILMLPNSEKLDLRWITLGGEIANQHVLSSLSKRFSAGRITHVYASTEAGVGFSVRDGLAGFPVPYVQDGVGSCELRVDEVGKLWLRKRSATQHYVGESIDLLHSDGWVDSGDMVELSVDSNRYYFLGRENGTINVGGSKVHPAVVEQVIQEVPGVKFVAVRGRKNPIMGSLVEAVVVPDSEVDESLLRSEIQRACREKLERFQQPATILFVADIELSAVGKLQR